MWLLAASKFYTSLFAINIWFAPGTGNIFNPASWVRTKFSFAHPNVHTADVFLCDLPGYFNHRSVLSYNYDQNGTGTEGIQANSLRQAFSGLTLAELYDALVRAL